MKLFSLRDNLINYFMTPFCAPSEREAMAAVSAAVNREGSDDAIAATPSHFELWELGSVDPEGVVTASKQLVCSCNSLKRPSERENQLRLAFNERRGSTNGAADNRLSPTASGSEPPTPALRGG